MADAALSYMSPLGYEANSCGYCHSGPQQTSLNYYAQSRKPIRPVHYQGLMDRGWRRSGTTFYKPDVRHACCPHYTIRLDAAEFKPAKDQRGAVNKFNDYILGTDYKRAAARLCPKSREEKKFRRNHFALCPTVHEAEYSKVQRPIDRSTKAPIEPAHRLEITLEPDNYTDEKYALFAHYQKTVHKEPPSSISKRGFRSFLCGGLGQSTYDSDGKTRKIGSYHQCYRLDGRLIAMGVLDLLPLCVSSVYLLYHDDVSDWTFGKLSALQEIALALEGGYGYYYMGYYIHSCAKMRYKGTFQPQRVLDPENYEWNLLDADMLARFSARSYVSLSRELRLGISASDSGPSSAEIFDTNRLASMGLFDVDMPGVMTREEVQRDISLDVVRAGIGEEIFTLGHLRAWGLEDVSTESPLTAIAELLACLGKDLAKEIVVVLG